MSETKQFRPPEFPALAEYGATLAEVEAAEERTIKEIRAERKAGKLVEFSEFLEPHALVAHDILDHDEVRAWIKGRKGG